MNKWLFHQNRFTRTSLSATVTRVSNFGEENVFLSLHFQDSQSRCMQYAQHVNNINPNVLSMFKALNKCLSKYAQFYFILYHVEGRLKLLKFQHWNFSWLSTFRLSFSKEYSRAPKCCIWVISDKQPAACGLSHISCAYLTWVAMWDRFFQHRANIGITGSCMLWYVRKNNLT